jgi:putative peptidoglycan lipid II flippase
MLPLYHVGIALAASVANWTNATLLAIVLRRRGFLRFDSRFKQRVPRTLLATGAMAVSLVALSAVLAPWFTGMFVERAAALILLIGTGLAVFGILAHLFGAAKLGELKTLLGRKRAVA